VNNKQ